MVVMCVIDQYSAPTRSNPGHREITNRLGGLEDDGAVYQIRELDLRLMQRLKYRIPPCGCIEGSLVAMVSS